MYGKDEEMPPNKLGTIVYFAMFTVYIGALVVMAIAGVGWLYFFAVALLGFPVSGANMSMVQGTKWLQRSEKPKNTVTMDELRSEYVDKAGQPVIKL